MSDPAHILVIDDEPQILRALRTILVEKGFKVTVASRGEEGLTLAAADQPDLVILDLGLPDMDGIDVCGRLREWTQCPILVLSVRDSEREKVAALDKGADDYLTKPFGIEELLARVRVAMRHRETTPHEQATRIEAGRLVIDLAWHTVTRDGKPVRLTATEFNLLAYLVQNRGRVLTHHSILTYVWGPEDAEHTEYLRVYMRQLRKKLEENPDEPQHLLTEPGVGYRFLSEFPDNGAKPK
jgi:two-component system KDP operon response regulator KdpE